MASTRELLYAGVVEFIVAARESRIAGITTGDSRRHASLQLEDMIGSAAVETWQRGMQRSNGAPMPRPMQQAMEVNHSAALGAVTEWATPREVVQMIGAVTAATGPYRR